MIAGQLTFWRAGADNWRNRKTKDGEESEYAAHAVQRVGLVRADRYGAAEWVSESQPERLWSVGPAGRTRYRAKPSRATP